MRQEGRECARVFRGWRPNFRFLEAISRGGRQGESERDEREGEREREPVAVRPNKECVGASFYIWREWSMALTPWLTNHVDDLDQMW